MFDRLFRAAFLVIFALAAMSFVRQAAFAQIAPGVQQSAAQGATITGTVSLSDGTLVSGADVKLIGPAILSTTSDAHGAFQFTSVPHGIYTLVANAGNLGTATKANVAVSGDVTIQIQYAQQSTQLKTIANVTTKAVGAHINVTGASIASLTPSDYAFQGNSSWQQLLNGVPGVTVGGGIRSGTSCAVGIPFGPFQPVILSVNGALPYETSVTLDGMPLVNSAPSVNIDTGGQPGGGTDVSFLPLTTFDTADVVRGPGANAPSIVDSIGGSFVLHPPSAVTGNHFEFSLSNDSFGGIVANAKAALKWGRLSAIFTYGVNDSPGPLGSNYKFMPAFAYWPEYVNGQFVTGGLGDGVSFPGYPGTGPGCCPNNNSQAAAQTAMYCCFTTSTQWTQHNGAASLSYAITPAIAAQVFYAGSSTSSIDPSPKYQIFFEPDSSYSGSLAPGTYILPTNIAQAPINKSESLVEEKITAYLGGGVLRLAALQNNSGYNILLAPTFLPNGQYQLWGTLHYASAPNTPVNFNGQSVNLQFFPYTYGGTFWTNNRDLLASYGLQLGSRANAEVSYSTSYYNAPVSSTFIFGGFPIPYNTFPPDLAETTNEFHVGAGTQLSDNLSLNASWYFARGNYHVPDPDNPTAWKDATFPYSSPRLSAVWRATPNIAVRAAAGGGYALPPIAYLNGTNSVNLPCTNVCSESVTNLSLKPETSFGFDLGADVRFNRNTVVSADIYRTNLFGQFYQASTPSGTYQGLPLYINQYDNLGVSRYEGINLDARHDVPTGLYWNVAVGFTRAYVVNSPPGFYDGTLPYTSIPCTNCANTNVVPGINFNGSFGSTVPYANGTATVGYRWRPDTFIDLQPTYYGNGNAYFEPAFVEWDAHAGYSLTKNVTLYATARNILGSYDANIQTLLPTSQVPAIPGANPNTLVFPSQFIGVPYGPRTVIVTLNFKT